MAYQCNRNKKTDGMVGCEGFTPTPLVYVAIKKAGKSLIYPTGQHNLWRTEFLHAPNDASKSKAILCQGYVYYGGIIPNHSCMIRSQLSDLWWLMGHKTWVFGSNNACLPKQILADKIILENISPLQKMNKIRTWSHTQSCTRSFSRVDKRCAYLGVLYLMSNESISFIYKAYFTT